MSTTPPDEPTGAPGPDYGAPPPSGPDYGTPPGGYGTPPGGYGTPPPGGYGTPPGGGYGAPPPPPGGYGPTGEAWNLGDALSYGWAKFQANVAQILLTALVFLVAVGVAIAIGIVIVGAMTHGASLNMETGEIEGSTSFIGRAIAQSLAGLVVNVVLMVLGAAIVRGALDVTEGRPFELGASFSRVNFGNVVVASIIVAVLTTIGSALCYVPGLIVGFLTSYTLYFLVDRDLGALEAIKASFEFTTRNLGNTVLWYLVGGIVAVIGFCLCGVGALVTVPVVVLGTAFTYKRLTGQPVAA